MYGGFYAKENLKRKTKVFQFLIDLYSDERDVVDQDCIAKVKKLMNQFVEIFVKKQHRGKVSICPIIY